MGETLWLVYNPRSGGGRGLGVARRAEAILSGTGCRVEARATAGPQQAAELVGEAVERQASRIVVVGGDGTFRDAVAGLQGAAVPVALVPAGTGNDLARTLRIPRGVQEAARLAAAGTPRRVDVWRWNDVPFINVAGLGLDAAVAAAVNRRAGRLRGAPAYLLAVLETLPRYRPVQVTLRGDDWEYSGRAMLVATANGQFYGGGMRIAPRAVVDDGLLSVVVVEEISRLHLIRQMPKVFAGTHLGHPRVRCYATSRLAVETESREPVTLDGELIGGLPAVVVRDEDPAWIVAP